MWIPRWTRLIVESVAKESRTIQEALKNQEQAIHDGTKASEEKQWEIGNTIADAIQAAAATVPEYEKTQRKKEYSLQRNLFWATLFAAVFAAIAAGAAIVYTRIAGGAVKATQDALYAEQRPWVALYIQEQNVQPGSDTVVNQESIVTRNTGRTPAVHVRLACFAQPTSDSQNGTPDCESLKKRDLQWRRDMLEKRYREAFPGISDSELQRRVEQQEKLDAQSIQKMESSTDKEWMIPPDSKEPLGEGFIQAFNSQNASMNNNFVYMVGVLTYQDLLETGKTHVTKFCLVKWRSTPAQFCRRGQWMD